MARGIDKFESCIHCGTTLISCRTLARAPGRGHGCCRECLHGPLYAGTKVFREVFGGQMIDEGAEVVVSRLPGGRWRVMVGDREAVCASAEEAQAKLEKMLKESS